MQKQVPSGSGDAAQAERAPVRASLVLNSNDLLQGRNEVMIRHDGQDYRLRVTRQNKLILTK